MTLNGVATAGEVLVYADPGNGFVEIDAVETDAGGHVSVELFEGQFILVPALNNPPTPLLPTLPTPIDIQPGLPPSPLVLSLFTPDDPAAASSQLLSGTVTADGVSIDTELLVLQGGLPIALLETPGGFYQTALPADVPRVFELTFVDHDLPPNFLPPQPAPITVGPTGIAGGTVVDNGGNFSLDIQIDVDAPGTATISGTVNLGGVGPLADLLVETLDLETESPGPSATTDENGGYTLELPPGAHELILADLAIELVEPDAVDVDIFEAEGSFDVVVEGEIVPDGVIDWVLLSTEALLTGTVSMPAGSLEAEVEVFPSGAEKPVTAANTEFGAYQVKLPAGSLNIFVEVDNPPTDLLFPQPVVLLVGADGIVDFVNQDFAFVAIDGAHPGQLLTIEVLSSGVPVGPQLDVVVLNDAGAIVSVFETNEVGRVGAALPPGNYTARVLEGDVTLDFEVTASDVQVGGTPAPGNLVQVETGL